MEAANSSIFDFQHLQYLNYERSKTWSNFIDRIQEDGIENEISLKDIDRVFTEQDESDNDELASIEDVNCIQNEVDVNILQEMHDCVSRRTRSRKKKCSGEMKESNKNDLEDFVNQTLPILNAYSRHLKESGIETVLNTFDVEKIEEKVGTWLKNSTFKEIDNTLLVNTSSGICLANEKQSNANANDTYNAVDAVKPTHDDSESSESLHSGDTARYIRSSRSKRNNTFKNISNNTIIKTYRMIKSKREALKEKYNCDKHNDENMCEPAVHCRSRNILRPMYCKPNKITNDKYSCIDYQGTIPSSRYSKYDVEKHCRKVLRKRSSNNSYSETDSNSTDSDYYEMSKNCHRKRLNTIRKRHLTALLPPISSPHCHKYDNCHNVISPHRSAHRLSSFPAHCHSARRCRSRCNSGSYTRKPIRLESECRCYYEPELCAKFNHISDTSTEEWMVDNFILDGTDNRINKKSECKTEKEEEASTKTNHSESNYKFQRYFNNHKGLDNEIDENIKMKKNSLDTKALAKNIQQIRKRQMSMDHFVNEESMAKPFKSRYYKSAKISNNKQQQQMDKTNDEQIFFENLNTICNSTALTSYKGFAKERRILKMKKSDSLPTDKKLETIDEQLNTSCKKTDLTVAADTASVAITTTDAAQLNTSSISSTKNHCSNGDSPTEACDSVKTFLTTTAPTTTTTTINDTSHKFDCTKPILVYTPQKGGPSTSGINNISNGYINITKEHLAPIIGEQATKKFFRYYAGRKQFNMNSNIYFRPPATNTFNTSLATSGSSDDLELIGEYGQLFES